MKIAITGHASISPLGVNKQSIKENLSSPETFIQKVDGHWQAPLTKEASSLIETLSKEKHLRHADRSTLLAVWTSRQLKKHIDSNSSINIGSSRGATEVWEKHHKTFIESGIASPFSSPYTTLGNVSSIVAQDLGLEGLSFSHSITCSTALHSIVNACAWLTSGLSESFVVGGTEAPLTPFTLQQMKALGIYSDLENEYPCQPFNGEVNSMVLGEACAMFVLKRDTEAKFYIKSIGFATEKLQSASGISSKGECLQKSMQMALNNFDGKVDLCMAHAPGTVKGDSAEMEALKSVFGTKLPPIWSNKWKVGHTLGASGALSLDHALYILAPGNTDKLHHLQGEKSKGPINNILINAVGFGGNAVSIVVGN